MGSTVVRTLAKQQRIEVVVADRDEKAAQDLASELKIKALGVDVVDRSNLESVLDSTDVVVNCVGPFFRFAPRICLTAVRRGVHYVDICDDAEPTLEMLTYDSLARASGATAVLGCGWTPGSTHICARLGANMLDSAETVDIAWVASESDVDPEATGGLAVEQHVLHILSRPVTVFRNGEWTTVSPLAAEPLAVDAPDPLGRVRAYLTGHPEPITLPRYLPALLDVTVRGAIVPEAVDHIYSLLVKLGAADSEEKMAEAGQLLADLAHYFATEGRPSLPPYSAAVVEVKGKRDGAAGAARFTCLDHMSRLTGVPAAIAAVMIAKGEVPRAGVMPPEAAFDPQAFLAELEREGIAVTQTLGNGRKQRAAIKAKVTASRN
jgi:saccharopine dehydrogenase-like NADP-dependent oxidoreductase